MKTFRKTLLAFMFASVCVLINTTAAAQTAGGCEKSGTDKQCCGQKKKYYKVGQWVDVDMKDNTIMRARVLGKMGKNKYWLQQIGGDRKGVCHARYLTPAAPDAVPFQELADARQIVAVHPAKRND